eukprot:08027_1
MVSSGRSFRSSSTPVRRGGKAASAKLTARRRMPACTNDPRCCCWPKVIRTSSHKSAWKVPTQSMNMSVSLHRHISIVAVTVILSSEIVHFRQPSIRILTRVVPGGTVTVQPEQARRCKVGSSGSVSDFISIASFSLFSIMVTGPCFLAAFSRKSSFVS